MINKINLYSKVYIVTFLIFLIFLLYFIGVEFSYIITKNYFLLNQKYVDKDIVIVALDDKTINSNNYKKYQDIGRSDYAELLKNISYDEPKIIFTDVVFSSETNNACKINDDKRLLEFIKKNPNTLFNTEILEEYEGTNILNNVIIPKENLGYPNIKSLNSINIFSNIISGPIIHNNIPVYNNNDIPFLPIPFEIYKRVNNISDYKISKNQLQIGNKKINIPNNNFYINFFTKTYPEFSFIDVKNGNVPPGAFKDKIVFLGATAQDIHDSFMAPISPKDPIPGVIILANAYNTISSGKYLNYPNIYVFLIINFTFLGLIYAFFERFKRLHHSMLYSFFILVLFVIFGIISFSVFGYFIEILPFVVSYVFLHIFIFIKRYLKEKKSKDEIQNIFGRYISKDVVDELIKTGIDNLKLGGYKRNITVFFSDLAGFTDLSENLDPADLGKILNIYFEEMSNLVLINKGTIDKYIGDALMAFWNAPLDVPDHADLACKTAIAQRIALLKVRDELKAMGSNVYIDMRIGINTGDCVVGNFGCSKRYDYTALGDTVNLSSRLEGINKEYATNIIINETTYNAITKNMFITRELDIITVKGKKKPVKIYELIGLNNLSEFEKLDLYKEVFKMINENKYDDAIAYLKQINNDSSFKLIKTLSEKRNIELYSRALDFYKEKDFISAIYIFKKINDEPSKKFITRCEYYIKNPPPADWDGVYRFKTK